MLLITRGLGPSQTLITQGLGGGTAPTPEPEAVQQVTYGGGDHSYELRVRNWWNEIERLRAERQEREDDERRQAAEIARKLQEIADLEAERARRRKRAEKERLRAEIAAVQAEIRAAERETSELREQALFAAREIARIQAEIDAAEAMRLAEIMTRRRAAMALMLMASMQ